MRQKKYTFAAEKSCSLGRSAYSSTGTRPGASFQGCPKHSPQPGGKNYRISLRVCKNLNEPSNSAQRVPNPFRAVNKQVTQGTKPSVLNSLVTRATLWLSNTKSHGLLKTKRLLYQLRIPDQKLFQTTSYATINDSDLVCN